MAYLNCLGILAPEPVADKDSSCDAVYAPPATSGILKIPEGAKPASYFACLLASSLSMVFLGIQATLTLMMAIEPPQAAIRELTAVGIFNFRPEHDVSIFLLGLPVTIGLVAFHAWIWNRRLRGQHSTSVRSAVLWGGTQLAVGLAMTGVYLYEFTSAQQHALRGEPIPRPYFVIFALVAAILVFASFSWASKFASFEIPIEGERRPGRALVRVWDVLFAALVALFIYVPSAEQLSKHIFQAERFFHWDFFAMAPALGYANGGALGTDVFSFYGVGWPVLFALASPIVPLSYDSMIYISALVGCAYFIGIYVLLRLLTNRPIWAAAGTLLALRIHLFSGLAYLSPLWRFPSVTVMRRPFDVWFFIALVMHLRNPKPAWLLGAAGLAGAAVLFETDTGIYLVATLALYWLGRLVQSPDRKKEIKLLGGSVGVAGAAVFIGLLVASRGTIFSSSFWQGWLENLKLSSAGYTLMPLIGRIGLYEGGGPVHGRHLTLFFFVIAVYAAVMANLVIKLLHRRATYREIVVASLAFYGFLSMTQFMGRTDPLNLYPVMIPFAVLIAIMLSRVDGILVSSLPKKGVGGPGWRGAFAHSATGFIAVAAVCYSLVAHEPFQRYPNAFLAFRDGVLPNESCLTDVPVDPRFLSTRGPACGAQSSHDREKSEKEFPRVVGEVGLRGRSGERVAILDQDGPIYYVAAQIPPWGKYSPLFPNLVTKERLATVVKALQEDAPENVLIRSMGEHDPLYEDIRAKLFDVISRKYYLDGRIGSFELWRRQGLTPTRVHSG